MRLYIYAARVSIIQMWVGELFHSSLMLNFSRKPVNQKDKYISGYLVLSEMLLVCYWFWIFVLVNHVVWRHFYWPLILQVTMQNIDCRSAQILMSPVQSTIKSNVGAVVSTTHDFMLPHFSLLFLSYFREEVINEQKPPSWVKCGKL